jgi:hypothetical protein
MAFALGQLATILKDNPEITKLPARARTPDDDGNFEHPICLAGAPGRRR